MKLPPPRLEWLTWLASVPLGARYDLTASGIREPGSSESPDPMAFAPDLDVAAQFRTDPAGPELAALTREVAERYLVEPDQVAATLGATLAITQVLFALVRPGDHVVVERPTYEPLARMPALFGAHVSRLERKLDEGWRVVPERLAKLLTPRTRAVVLTNLHCPTGVATSTEDLAKVAELTDRVGATLLVDEVFLDFAFDPLGPIGQPACKVAENAVSWSSATKCFGAGAARSGWIVAGDRATAAAIRSAGECLFASLPVATLQIGAAVLRAAGSIVSRHRPRAENGRRIVSRWVDADPRIEWTPPYAGLAGTVRLPALLQDVAFCEHLRERYETQVVPGSLFEAPGTVRVGYGLEPSRLEQGLANFSAALDDLVGQRT